MRLKSYVGLILVVLFVCAACNIHAQSAPAATENRLPLAIGAGFSGYNPDANYGKGHLLGGTLWIDYTLHRVPFILRGLGIAAEARDLNYGRSSSQALNLREDTAEGGVIYSWPHFRNFRPYGEFLAGYGNFDSTGWYPNGAWGKHYHDSRNFLAGGAGFDYRVFRNIWVRADYEYQVWPDSLKGHLHPNGTDQTPRGITVGAMYHFDHLHSH